MSLSMFHLARVAAAAIAILFWSTNASAYNWMIRHGYTACAQCHADPSGGSLLNEYGRSLAEVELRTQYSKATSDPSRIKDFAFGAVKLPDSLLLGGDVRGLILHVRPKDREAITRYVLMQADLQAQVTVSRFRVNASAGFVSEGAKGATIVNFDDSRSAKFISRTHWVGVDLGQERDVLVRAGRMNLPFGLRSIEHTLWVRGATRTDLNDAQQYGVAVAYTGEKVRAEAMLTVGNFALRPTDYRDYGVVGYGEYAITEKLAVGASALVMHSPRDLFALEPQWRQAYGAFARYSPVKALVLSAETDFLLNVRSRANSRSEAGIAAMLQADVEAVKGLHFMATGELLHKDFSTSGTSLGGWGSAAWFFLPHTDVRLDAIYRSTADTTGQSQSLSLLAQLHMFL